MNLSVSMLKRDVGFLLLLEAVQPLAPIVMPDKKQSLIEEANAIGVNREVAGLHYPADTKAGISLSRQFVDLLLQDPEFQALLKKAQTEVPEIEKTVSAK